MHPQLALNGSPLTPKAQSSKMESNSGLSSVYWGIIKLAAEPCAIPDRFRSPKRSRKPDLLAYLQKIGTGHLGDNTPTAFPCLLLYHAQSKVSLLNDKADGAS